MNGLHFLILAAPSSGPFHEILRSSMPMARRRGYLYYERDTAGVTTASDLRGLSVRRGHLSHRLEDQPKNLVELVPTNPACDHNELVRGIDVDEVGSRA